MCCCAGQRMACVAAVLFPNICFCHEAIWLIGLKVGATVCCSMLS